MTGRNIGEKFAKAIHDTELPKLCKETPGAFLSVLNDGTNYLQFYWYGKNPVNNEGEKLGKINNESYPDKIDEIKKALKVSKNENFTREKQFQFFLAWHLNKSHSDWTCLCPEYGIPYHYNKKGTSEDERVGRQDLVLIHKNGYILFVELKVYERHTYGGDSGLKKHLLDFKKINDNWNKWNIGYDLQCILEAQKKLKIYHFHSKKDNNGVELGRSKPKFIFITFYEDKKDADEKYLKKIKKSFDDVTDKAVSELNENGIDIDKNKYPSYYINYNGDNELLFKHFHKIINLTKAIFIK